jgi:hypothetical protein
VAASGADPPATTTGDRPDRRLDLCVLPNNESSALGVTAYDLPYLASCQLFDWSTQAAGKGIS